MANRFDNCPNVRRVLGAFGAELTAVDLFSDEAAAIADEAADRIQALLCNVTWSAIDGTTPEFDQQWPEYAGPITTPALKG